MKKYIMITKRQDKIHINVIIISVCEKVTFVQVLVVSVIYQIFYEISCKFNDIIIILTDC